MQRIHELRSRWKKLCANLAGEFNLVITEKDMQDVFSEFFKRYGEGFRSIHDTKHVIACINRAESALSILEGTTINTSNPHRIVLEVETAIWFHDLVVDGKGRGDIEDSANLARLLLRSLGLPSSFSVKISNMIGEIRRDNQSEDTATQIAINIHNEAIRNAKRHSKR